MGFESTEDYEKADVSTGALEKVHKEIENTFNIPPGYIKVNLSTKGYLGAPKEFYIRNMSTEDLLSMALTDDEDLPVKTYQMLQSLIYGDDVDIKDFHEAEVIETLVTLYRTFYSPYMKNLDYRLSEKDWDFIANQCGGRSTEDFRSRERSYKNGEWKPKIDINLETLKTYPVDNNLKTKVKCKKKDGFTCTYSFPRYGDVIVLREFLKKLFKEKDKQFESLERTYRYRIDAEKRIRDGENINYQSLPTIPKAELDKLKAYQEEKSIFVMVAVRALHLIEFDGEDLSNTPLEKKMEYARDPRLDYTTFTKISDYFNSMNVGLEKRVEVYNPVTGGVEKVDWTFRLYDILQAIRDNGSDEVNLEFI